MGSSRVILIALALTGCASVPDHRCFSLGVETRPQHQPAWTRCDVVTEVPMGKAEVFKACRVGRMRGHWGCINRDPLGSDGRIHCIVRYYEGDHDVLEHERCHLEHGPNHAGPLTLGEIFGR